MPLVDVFGDRTIARKIQVNQSGITLQIVPRVAQRGRKEPDVSRLLDRVVEVERVRVRGRDDCEQNHVVCYIR